MATSSILSWPPRPADASVPGGLEPRTFGLLGVRLFGVSGAQIDLQGFGRVSV